MTAQPRSMPASASVDASDAHNCSVWYHAGGVAGHTLRIRKRSEGAWYAPSGEKWPPYGR
eukprot:6205214-Prymnesium_polylepis.1